MTSITSAMENAFVWSNFMRDSNSWLGGKVALASTFTRTWAWEDSSSWDYSNWVASSEGGNAGITKQHDCIHMRKADQQWDDVNCSGSKPYVCKK